MWRVALLAAVAACSHGLTPDSFASAELDARCTHEVKCGLFTDRRRVRGVLRPGRGPEPGAAVEAHRTKFDASAASTCVDAIENASCDASARDTRLPPDACNQVFVGLGKSGAPCAAGDECTSGNCVVPACGAACCNGTCGDPIPIPPVGQMCTDNCGPDAVCNDNSLCVALAPPGGSCAREPTECTYGYGCTGTIGHPTGTCTKLPGIGSGCPDGDCGDVGAVCNTQLVCAKAGLPGDPCTSANDCSPYYRCSLDRQVRRVPDARHAVHVALLRRLVVQPRRRHARHVRRAEADRDACVANRECETLFCDTSAGNGSGTCKQVPTCI